jgi:hypothetical protein
MLWQCLFSGVERTSGKTFLIPAQDRTVDTLVIVISDWIEPDTMVISFGRLTGTWTRTDTDTKWFNHKIVIFNIRMEHI